MKEYIILLSLLLFLVPPVSASYAGDRPLITVFHDRHNGRVEFTLGNSTYSGEMKYNDTYTVNFKVTVPASGSIKLARAYAYWVWSKKELEGIYPLINASISSNGVINPVSSAVRYTDTKGFASRYDYFSGVDVYDLNGKISRDGTYSISLSNSADDGRTFALQGVGLLVVYESQDMPVIEYWINEGADMLYAEYGITPKMATTTTYFKGDVDTGNVRKATLITASPSGGYSPGEMQAHNRLYFNEKTEEIPILGDIIRMLFGSGKVWKDVYLSNDSVQIGLDEREVTNYMKTVDNFVSIQDSGDYMMATNAILVLELNR